MYDQFSIKPQALIGSLMFKYGEKKQGRNKFDFLFEAVKEMPDLDEFKQYVLRNFGEAFVLDEETKALGKFCL